MLLISFARSGNSPESLAVFNMVNEISHPVYHIIITCNADGQLYNANSTKNILRILLPPETNDKSLAMTSSFSSMMLACLLISKIDTIEAAYAPVHYLAEAVTKMINNYAATIREIAKAPFQRAIFLGSGPLRGTAREAHLKLQELTDGKVICKCDSFLGFRHGPKAVIDNSTLLVYLFSDDPYVRQYEYDLVNQINAGRKGLCQVAVFHKEITLPVDLFNFRIALKCGEMYLPDDYLCVMHVVFPQLLGMFKSLHFGLSPDSPSKSGTISRVVTGVNIYPYKNTK